MYMCDTMLVMTTLTVRNAGANRTKHNQFQLEEKHNHLLSNSSVRSCCQTPLLSTYIHILRHSWTSAVSSGCSMVWCL